MKEQSRPNSWLEQMARLVSYVKSTSSLRESRWIDAKEPTTRRHGLLLTGRSQYRPRRPILTSPYGLSAIRLRRSTTCSSRTSSVSSATQHDLLSVEDSVFLKIACGDLSSWSSEPKMEQT